MKKKKFSWVSVCNFACALLMVALMICQFTLPFWVDSDGETATIQGYLWLCEEDQYKQLNKDLKEEFGKDYKADVWAMPLLCLLLSLIGTGLILFNSRLAIIAALPLACGILGIRGYMTKPIYQTGNLQAVHLALCFAITVAAVCALAVGVIEFVKKKKAAQKKA